MVPREKDPQIQKLQNDVFAKMQNIVQPNQKKIEVKQVPNIDLVSQEAQDNVIKALEELKKLNAL